MFCVNVGSHMLWYIHTGLLVFGCSQDVSKDLNSKVSSWSHELLQIIQGPT